jgi:hypothetical protein
MHGRVWLGLAIAGLVALLTPALAAAAPPNDNRANARTISPGQSVNGTVQGATRESNEPGSFCAPEASTVWYRVKTSRQGRIIVNLQANGDMDAVVDVYRVRRSQLDQQTCDTTGDNGRSTFDFGVGPGQTYLIRVARRSNSTEHTFRLKIQFGRPPAQPPGRPLPRGGATGTLDRVLVPSVAYSVRLHAGTTYRFNLATGDACTPLSLYPPGTDSFELTDPVKSRHCGGYMTFTPDLGESGRYSLLAEAPRQRGSVPYRLMAARAGSDDTAPGKFIHNHSRVHGRLNGHRIDVLDLYRFDVTKRSRLTLKLLTDEDEFDVRLIGAGGRRIARSSDEIETKLKPGRYFAVVRTHSDAAGSYRLSRVSRTITRTHMHVNGRFHTKVRPGENVKLLANVRPRVGGRVLFRIQRYDPVSGWQFFRAYRTRADRRTGRAEATFAPPTVGRWRVRAEFLGTFASSPSQSGFATIKAVLPLRD